MTTTTITTSVGTIPNPSNWGERLDSNVMSNIDVPETVLFLEKATDGRVTLEDISGALD